MDTYGREMAPWISSYMDMSRERYRDIQNRNTLGSNKHHRIKHTGVGKSRFKVVSTWHSEFILILLFINDCIIFHTNNCILTPVLVIANVSDSKNTLLDKEACSKRICLM